MIVLRQPAWLTLALMTVACGPSIADLDLQGDGTVDDNASTDSPGAGSLSPTDPANQPSGTDPDDADPDGPITLQVDATNQTEWVYIDLASGDDVGEAGAWTLAFRRNNVMLNGGVSGDGGVEVAWLDATFDSVTEAPADGWVTDEADADEDGVPEYALADWFDYDVSTHVLTPAAGTWAVRAVDGTTYALIFTTYYDAAGTSGFPTVRYRPIADAAIGGEG